MFIDLVLLRYVNGSIPIDLFKLYQWRKSFKKLLCKRCHRRPMNSPHKGPVTRSFDVFYDLRLNKRLSKQSWGWWFEALSCPLWRHCNVQLCLPPMAAGMIQTMWSFYLINYRKTSDISRTLVGNKIVDNSDVVGASPVGAAPTTSSFST